MSEKELSEMTVMQLRKLAKERGITLGAGIDKAGIIQKLLADDSASSPVPDSEADHPSDSSANENNESEPRFQAAWHNSDAPRYSARPAYQAPGTARPAWQSTTPSGHPVVREPQRVQPSRPGGFTPRFGPAAAAPVPSKTSMP